MKCPFCASRDSRVIDTREIGDGIRRRRECQSCKRRFTTYERVAPIHLLVIKSDGRREEFDREKIMEGIQLACTKRPVSSQDMEDITDQISAELYASGEQEIPSRQIGEMVMERLRKLDQVAYVRFASVYRKFKDIDSLMEEIEELKEWQQAVQQAANKDES